MTTVPAHFAWHELTTINADGATAFYPSVLPWTVQAMDDTPDYALWLNDGVPVGGVRGRSNAADDADGPVGWMPYVHVYDVDEIARRVPSLGGRVLTPPREMPSVGCWAVLADPRGAGIGIYEPADDAPPRYTPARRGEFSWHELATDDFEAAFDFYKKLFDWERTASHDMGTAGTYQVFGQAGLSLGGMLNKPSGAPNAAWMSYIRTDDVQTAASRIAAVGGTVLGEPHEAPGGDWIVRCRDAQGAAFALQSSPKQPA